MQEIKIGSVVEYGGYQFTVIDIEDADYKNGYDRPLWILARKTYGFSTSSYYSRQNLGEFTQCSQYKELLRFLETLKKGGADISKIIPIHHEYLAYNRKAVDLFTGAQEELYIISLSEIEALNLYNAMSEILPFDEFWLRSDPSKTIEDIVQNTDIKLFRRGAVIPARREYFARLLPMLCVMESAVSLL